ncbi:hypothetical protein [Cognaticolwellia aestuarii]|uniref:hypothetical protein n=1 Tax=Cognaticolwellia aestuarii TaxID=329993 RepID=UPI0009854D5B|nr:hypothetical protein [Cognaticolwellia aestuarii]
MKKTPIISLIMLGLLSLTTQAESLNDGLINCTKITNSSARLSCFDKLASVVTSSNISIEKSTTTVSTAKASVAAPRPTPTPSPVVDKVANFGLEHIEKPNKSDEDAEIVFVIASLKKDPYGKYRFTFENGQQWKQTDSSRLKVRVGESVVLRKGFMDSIFLKQNKADSNKEIRVKRLK